MGCTSFIGHFAFRMSQLLILILRFWGTKIGKTKIPAFPAFYQTLLQKLGNTLTLQVEKNLICWLDKKDLVDLNSLQIDRTRNALSGNRSQKRHLINIHIQATQCSLKQKATSRYQSQTTNSSRLLRLSDYLAP